jgi:SAM-dependent methyltransferase
LVAVAFLVTSAIGWHTHAGAPAVELAGDNAAAQPISPPTKPSAKPAAELSREATETAAQAPADPAPNRDPHGPRDVFGHIQWLESSDRDSFQKPDEIVDALHLDPAAIVADLGCGPGYFTRRLARAVPRGLVYAVDVEPRQLYRLQEHVLADELHNVIPVLASPSDPHLPPGQIDVILVVDTYHHFDDRGSYLRTLARALKPHGRLAIVDYYKRTLPVGPPVDHKIARDEVLREVLDSGYTLLNEPSFLPYQYFLIFGGRDFNAGPASHMRSPRTAVPPPGRS